MWGLAIGIIQCKAQPWKLLRNKENYEESGEPYLKRVRSEYKPEEGAL
jgi:hypothetical protein